MANKGETGTIEISAYESACINLSTRMKTGIKVYKLLDIGLVDLYMKLISLGVHHKQKVQSYTHYWDRSKPMNYRSIYNYYIYYNTKWAKKYEEA